MSPGGGDSGLIGRHSEDRKRGRRTEVNAMVIEARTRGDENQIRKGALRVLTVGEVARILQLNDASVRRLLRKGDLRGFRIGRMWRIRLEALERFLDVGDDV